MGRMKIIALTLAAALAWAPAAWPVPFSTTERVKVFATCAGRLSALEEHQRLFDGPASEVTARRKAQFDDLIAALLQDAVERGLPGRQALAWQIEAKLALAALMQRVSFGQDPVQVREARGTVRERLRACDRLLLNG